MAGDIPQVMKTETTASAAGAIDPLTQDVQFLQDELGRIIRRHGDQQLDELVQEVRALAIRRRESGDLSDRMLHEKIASLSPTWLGELIWALSGAFDLTNLAEDRHRIRVLREREMQSHPKPRAESIGAAIEQLASQGMTAEQTQALLDTLCIELVFTAHPTEAKRKTVRDALRRLRQDLTELDRDQLLPRERASVLERIRTDLACLWDTDMIRPRKPTVLEEVRRALYVVESLWQVMPWTRRALRYALRKSYPNFLFREPTFLTFGSWIGGDRDGNPFVTADVTRQTLLLLRRTALEKHQGQVDEMIRKLSISHRRHPVLPALSEAVASACERWPAVGPMVASRSPFETYRQFMSVVRYRLEQTLAVDPFGAIPDAAYSASGELIHDLELVAASLRSNAHDELADGLIQDWIDRTYAFGFHLARLDIRENSRMLHQAIEELAGHVGMTSDYRGMNESEKQAFLSSAISAKMVARLDEGLLTNTTRRTLQLFELLHRVRQTLGSEPLGGLVVSMTHQPSDVLTMLWLVRFSAATMGANADDLALPIVPLFETVADLQHADTILDGLFSCEAYRESLARSGGLQMCMVGYSDGTKDGGYLAANWNLYSAQSRLASSTQRHGVELMVFHGRGGSLGRGGGPAARGIMSLPPVSVNGKVRMTEQGEVLAERYDDPQIAYRHFEQVTWATILVSSEQAVGADEGRAEAATKRVDQADGIVRGWGSLMDDIAERARKAYRALIEHPSFVAYFEQATPIDAIETLNIGSRPSRRHGERSLEDLRAIPYTFAWTQSRHMITAFYGLGAAMCDLPDESWAMMEQMYRDWPFFRGVIDNAELALVKSDMSIAGEYATLVKDEKIGAEIFSMIAEEYAQSRDAVLRITGRDELLAHTKWLKQSLRARNPYVDPLNLIQIELIRRSRRVQESADTEENKTEQLTELGELLRLSIQGIAAGMRTTG